MIWWINIDDLVDQQHGLVDQHNDLVDQHNDLVAQHQWIVGSTKWFGWSTFGFDWSTIIFWLINLGLAWTTQWLGGRTQRYPEIKRVAPTTAAKQQEKHHSHSVEKLKVEFRFGDERLHPHDFVGLTPGFFGRTHRFGEGTQRYPRWYMCFPTRTQQFHSNYV